MIRERENAALPGLPVRLGLLLALGSSPSTRWSTERARTAAGPFGIVAPVLLILLDDLPLHRASSSSTRTKAEVLQFFGRYVGHGQAAGPALGEPALHEEADLAADPQLRERAPEGQRQRRQSDRDCRGRRLARRRHRGSGVRGRRLQQLREGPDRSGAAQPGDQLHVRRPRRGRRCRCAATPPRSPST